MYKFLFSVSVVILYASAHAQHPNILISTKDFPNEVCIVQDPKDANKLLAGANINAVYTSSDGGLTWTEKSQKTTLGVWGDPVMAIDTDGRYYHFHLSKVKGAAFIDRIVCQSSIDGGLNFNDGSAIGKNGNKAQDKPWATIDQKNKIIHLVWTQFDKYDSKDPSDRSNILYSQSSNSGEIWTDPIQINQLSGDCRDSSDTVEGAVPAIGPNGEVYVSWAGPTGITFNSSENGKTWQSEEILVNPMPGGWKIDIPGIYRANGFPVTKCDISGGKDHGTIYVNWSDQSQGNHDTDIWLAKSTDAGKTWSERIRVNQDTTQTHQFSSWMEIDQSTGNIFIIYYDRSRYTDLRTDVTMAVSTDGGIHFATHQISESAFIPSDKIFFGDYIGITAQDEVVRPIWTALNDGQLSIHTAIVDYNLLFNPDNPITTLGYEKETKKMSIQINKIGYGTISIETRDQKICEWKKMKWEADSPLQLTVPRGLKPGLYRIKLKMKDSEAVFRQLVVMP